MTSPYDIGLERNAANFQPLTPLTFLERAASVYPDYVAIIHGSLRRTYAEFYARSRQLASALSQRGVGHGDTVSAMLANTPPMLEAHYGVPMCGAVLHSINTRLDPAVVAFQLEHADSRILIFDSEFKVTVEQALSLLSKKPILIEYRDNQYSSSDHDQTACEYEALLAEGSPVFDWLMPRDEWDAISISYTSGTTGDPKGVVSHHRGAYLLAQGNALVASIKKHAVYLWTLPMFHCNGWCFPWTLSAIIGTHVCLRQVRFEAMWDAIQRHKVTHLCGAPVVMSTLISESSPYKPEHNIHFFTAAAPPPERVLVEMKAVGFTVTHLYGLTETYGPAVVNDWHEDWDSLDVAEQARLKARQGVRYLPLEALEVLDPETMSPVTRDGKTIGEVMFRGNVVMKGYFKNKGATEEAFQGGWFHSGDLAVIHADGYIQLKDRAKDIIISGGENISSIEVEETLYKHPSVVSAAVVATPHDKWGETPCAFVELVEGAEIDATELRVWCKGNMAAFKVPGLFFFETIPKTSTGKIQKYLLRQRAKALASEESKA